MIFVCLFLISLLTPLSFLFVNGDRVSLPRRTTLPPSRPTPPPFTGGGEGVGVGVVGDGVRGGGGGGGGKLRGGADAPKVQAALQKEFVVLPKYTETPVVVSVNYTIQINQNLIQGSELEELLIRAENEVYRRGKTKIYFLHIHKAGGTHLCTGARWMHLKTPHFNCLPKLGGFHSPNRDWVPLGLMNETQLTRWAENSPWQFFSNEFFPIVHLPPPGAFVYVMCLRDPLDRVLSHYLHDRRFYPNASLWHRWPTFMAFVLDDNKLEGMSTIMQGEIEPERYPQPFGFSNYQTHMLTGCGNECDEQHLDLAKRRLSYFSVIIIKEEYEDTYKMMTKKFGWIRRIPQSRNQVQRRINANARKYLEKIPTALKRLRLANLLDLDLYEHAKLLAKRMREREEI